MLNASYNTDVVIESYDEQYVNSIMLFKSQPQNYPEMLNSFVEQYSAMDSKSLNDIQAYIDHSPTEIEYDIIYLGALIDELRDIRELTRDGRIYCLEQLKQDLLNNIKDGIIIDMGVGLMGPVAEAAAIGYGLYGDLKTALKFNRCLDTHY